MAIHRAARPESHFTSLHNDVLRDDRLSYRARGILAVILSHTDGWSTSAESLAEKGREGRDAIRSALGELEDAGYLKRERVQDDRGRWATRQVIYDRPQAEEQGALFAVTEPPTTGFQSSVNQPSVSQASIEDQEENNSPTGSSGAKPKPPATLVAEAHYEHVQGMCNFMAIRGIAARALKVQGTTVESVTAAMNTLYDQRRPITFQTVGQQLGASSARTTNQDHWAAGGQF